MECGDIFKMSLQVVVFRVDFDGNKFFVLMMCNIMSYVGEFFDVVILDFEDGIGLFDNLVEFLVVEFDKFQVW